MSSLKRIGAFCFSLAALTAQAQTGEPVSMRTLDGIIIKVPAVPQGTYMKLPQPEVEGYYAFNRSKPVYLSPKHSLEILDNGNGYLFKGKGSKENVVLDSLQTLPEKFFEMKEGRLAGNWWKTDPSQFYPHLEKLRKAAYNMISKVKGTTYFTRTANAEADAMVRRVAASFLYNYGLDPVKMEQMTEMQRRRAPQDSVSRVYESAKLKVLGDADKEILDSTVNGGIDLNNQELFIGSPGFRQICDQQLTRMAWKIPGKRITRDAQNEAKWKVVSEHITSPFIRDYYAYGYSMSILRTSDNPQQLDSIYHVFMSGATNQMLISAVKDVYTRRKKLLKGAPSPAFDFADTEGKKVSLQSLRGKYVYIDLWATWCGPCKAEIPYLKKIEEKFHTKNIAFVSISIDELKDKQKWLDFVKKEQLTGIQLMADKAWETEFVKDYTITGIPHFILLGPKGEIIESNAKRPSDPELQVQLEGLL